MKNMQQQVLVHEQTIKEEKEEEEEEEGQYQRGRGRDLEDEKEDGFVKIESSNPSYNMKDQSMNSCWEEEDVGGGGVMDGDHEDLLNVVVDHDDDTLMSYDDFPPLPDFPCISSSSSSSSSSSTSSSSSHPQHQHQHAPAVTCTPSSSTTTSSSASSSASWAMMKTNHHHHHHHHHEHAYMVSSTYDHHHGSSMEEIHHQNSQDEAEMINRMNSSECMDVLDGLGDMDLLDTDDMWDPSSLFPYEQVEEQPQEEEEEEIKDHQQQVLVQQDQLFGQRDDEEEEGDENKPSEDLAMVFFEWLKSNKESISAEDLRSIKLKRSTIECAAKRLGGGKEGMKQLVKLILEWVQNHHLQKKRDQASSLFPHQENPHQNSSPNPNSMTTPSWVSSLPPYDHSLMYPPPPPPPPPSMPSYMHGTHDPSLFASPTFNPTTNLNHVNPYPSSSSTHDYNMFDSSTTSSHSPNWPSTTTTPTPPPPPPHFSISSSQYMHQDSNLVPPPPQQVPTLQRSFSNYSCPQMFQGGSGGTTCDDGEGSLVRLGSSATKEARKNRMARQRKLFFHHHRSSSKSSTHHQHQQTRLVVDNSCTTTTPPPPPPLPLPIPNQANNWVYWPSSPSSTSVAAASLDPSPSMQNPQQNYQKQLALERRHGCKPVEKNLKFLLQKVLKQSDVGNLGRIVLPKKEAETYLPELEARDGISLAMEDIGTSRIWNMRYRFWPNNKSRMYLLENTGDFVRSNSLQEGDFIVIYLDVKCGKYMIRGVKVRQPGSKCEVKKLTKAHKNLHHSNSSVFDPSSSSFKQTVT